MSLSSRAFNSESFRERVSARTTPGVVWQRVAKYSRESWMLQKTRADRSRVKRGGNGRVRGEWLPRGKSFLDGKVKPTF
jgi:hypothetical protein